MKCKTTLASLIVTVLLAAFAASATADQENPALSLLNEDIIFYLSFDHGLLADLSVGDPEPVDLTGELRFEPGRFGQAILLGEGGLHRANFAAWRNIDLSTPGAMSFWIAPHDWLQRDETDRRPYLRFFNHRGARGGSVFVQRQGFSYVTREDGSLSRRHDRFQVGYYHFPEIDNAISSQSGSDRWPNGEWRFVVINWDRSSFAVSLNGSPARRVELSQALTSEDFPDEEAGLTMTLGSGESAETTLLDELIIYRRPLQDSEIERLYRQ